VLAVGVVFFFHLARVFDPVWWHVKNPQVYPWAGLGRLLVGQWMMPLLFVTAGAATFYALGRRGTAAFMRERAARLLVPFAVGVMTHIPLQVYFERRAAGQFEGTFFAWLPQAFVGVYGWGGNFAWMGLHLWFLPALFVLSVLWLPVMAWVKVHDTSQVQRTWKVVSLYAWALPLMGLLAALDPRGWPGNRDAGGWSLILYAVFFLYGFLIVALPGVEARIRAERRRALALAVLTSVGVALVWRSGEPAYGGAGFVAYAALYGLGTWCCLLALWGYATQYLIRGGPALRYASDAALPFYILHQTVLVAAAFYVVQWATPDWVKAGIIGTITFGVVMGLYEFVIRRHDAMRVLFGMRRTTHIATLRDTAGERVLVED
jgi:hypothetical protein